MGNEGIYSVSKNLVKQNITFCQIENFRGSFAGWPFLRDSCKNDNLAWLFIF